jgi:putative chitinase
MSLIKLQEKIGVTADGSFGPATIKAAAAYFKLSPARAAHFFGQTAHETGGYHLFSENLNYSASGLKETFAHYFPTDDLANTYARQPIKIASRVYADRMGNGNEASQEGYTFRGRGALQTTGKSNYQAFSDSLHKPEIMATPDLVSNDFSFESAIFFFDRNKLWDIADKGVNDDAILAITKRINGGTIGLDDRASLTKRYYQWLTQ